MFSFKEKTKGSTGTLSTQLGLGDVRASEPWRRAGIRGRDKQVAPDFCTALVKYFFLRVKCKIV